MAKTVKEKSEAPESQFRDIREELAFLRQKFSSLAMRGYYRDCFKQIEDNLKKLYFQERWPENFNACLLLHRRCFPSMDISAPYDEYLEKLLKKSGIPVVFVDLLGAGKGAGWTSEFFKERILRCREQGRLNEALDYADLMIKTDPLSSGGHLLRGWVLEDLGRSADAIACYERAVEINRSNYQASTALARIYAKSDPEKALGYIEQAIEQQPNEAELVAAKGEILFDMGNADEAFACLDKANQLDPLSAEYVYEKARMLDRAGGQQLAAIRQYRRVLTLDEDHLPTLRRLSELLTASQPELAISYSDKILEACPGDRDASLRKARLLEKTAGGARAITQYKDYLELDPSCAEAYGAIGRLLLEESPAEALGFLGKALELAPENADYYIGQGRCHLKMGNRPEALKAYHEAASRDKASAAAQAALGLLHMEEEPRKALGYFEAALRLDPENPHYYQSKGEILQKLPGSSPQDILACLDKAARLSPNDAELHLTLAKLLEESGNITSATGYYKTASGLDPSLEEAHLGLARLLMDSEPQSALPSINQAIYINPDRADYYYLKSIIYSKLAGNIEAARELRRSLSSDAKNMDALQELRQLIDGDAPRVAMMYINRALELSPRNPVYLCVRAGLLAELEDRDSAAGQYMSALRTDEGCHQAHFGLGKLLMDTDPDKAEDHLNRAIVLAPGEARYHAEKGAFLANFSERYKDALVCFDTALKMDNRMADAALGKAGLLEERGEVFAAMDYYRRALLINPDCLAATARMAALLSGLNPKAALVYIDKAVSLEPEEYIHHVWRGRILYALGDNEGGEAAAAKAVSLGGEMEEVYYHLALVLHDSIPEVALKYCSLAMSLSPQKAAYPLLCGNIYRKSNDYDAAMASYAGALGLDPSCHEAIARTAELMYLKGEADKSLALIDRAISINGGNASYYHMRSLILLSLDSRNLTGATECAREAIRLAPGNPQYREHLLTLLKKSGSHIRYLSEKRKADRLRRELRKAEEAAKSESFNI